MLDDLKIMIVAKIDEVKSALGIKKSLDDMGKNLSLPVTAKLDKVKSRQQLKNDLSTMNSLSINTSAKLNVPQSKKEIKKSLALIDKEKINITAELSLKTTQDNIKVALSGMDGNIKGSEQLNQLDDGIKRVNRSSLATVASITLLHQSIRQLQRAAKDMIDTSISLDKQLTDLRLVTGDNYDEARNMVAAYNDLARELHATTSQVLSASNEWLRQGRTIEETTELIRQSMVLSKVGNMEAALATKNLTSAMKGYGLEVENVGAIIDKLTAIDLKAAVTSNDLAVAMSRTASGANLAGVSMDRLLGYLATVEEVTQKSAETIGESFKTIFARMGNIKLGKFIDDDGENISDVEKVLSHFDIKLRDTKDEFRNFGDVIDDVGTRWESFTSIEQRAIANAFAGTRQQENFIVLMENYASALEYTEVAANSAGTALEKFAAYEDSIEAKMNNFRAAFESLSMNTLDAGLLKGFIDAGAAIITLIDSLDLLKISLSTLAAVGAAKGFTSLNRGAKALYQQVSQLSTAFTILQTTANGKITDDQFKQLLTMTKGLSDAQLRLIVSNKALSTEQRLSILTANGMSTAQARQTLAALGLVGAENAATAATFSLSSAMKALSAVIATNPIGFLIVGLTTAISVLSSVASNAAQASEEFKRMSQEAADAAASINEEAEKLDELIKKYKELKSVEYVDADTRVEIRDLQAEITDLVGGEVSNIDLVNGKLDDQIAKLREIQLEKAKQAQDSLVAEYYNAREASDNAAGSSSGSFAHPAFGSWDYIGGRDKGAEEVLRDAGYEWNVTTGGWFSNSTYVSSSFGDAEERAQALKGMLDALKEAADYDYQNSEIFAVLEKQYEAYLEYGDNVSSVIKNLTENAVLIATLEADSAGTIVNSIESYHDYRDAVIQAASESAVMENALSDNAVSLADITACVDDLMATNFPEWYNEVNTAADSDTVQRYAASLSSLKDTLTATQSAYSALATAQEEMNTRGGISADTVKKLADIAENYLDFLDVENGQLQLNTVAWKNLADEMLKTDMREISLETDSLIAQREAIEANIQSLLAMSRAYPDQISFRDEIAALDKELEQLDQAIAKNQDNLLKYKSIFASLQSVDLSNVVNGLDAISLAVDGMTNIISSIDDYASAMSTLVNVQEAIADSFTISLAQAKEFAAVYPEILNGATASADGQIILNEEVANSFIEAKRAELDAAVEAEITKLEADKLSLEAKKSSAEAQLELANAVASGEVDIENAKAQLLADAEQVLTQYLVDLGIEEVDAQKAAAEAKAGNMEEYARIVGDVADDNATNLAQSMVDAANSTKNNVSQMVSSLDALGRQAANVASQVASIGDGDVTYNGKVTVGGGGTGSSNFTPTYGNYDFFGVDPKSINVFDASLDQWVKNLELDISGYTQAIAQIDGQIAALQALRNLPLSEYKGGLGSSNKGSGSTKKEVEEYIAAINALYAAEEHLKDIQEQREYLQQQLNHTGDSEKRIAYMKQIIDLYEQEKEALHQVNNMRRQQIQENIEDLQSVGFVIDYDADMNKLFIHNMEQINNLVGDTAEETNELRKAYETLITTTISLNDANKANSKSWWDVQSSIKAVYAEVYEFDQKMRKNSLSLLENQYNVHERNKSYEDMSANLERQLAEYKAIQEAAQKEAQRLRMLGADENDEAVQACINTWWDAHNSIMNINKRIVDNVIGEYDKFIAYADDFDMWSSFDFTKIDYLKKKLAEVNRLFEQGILTLQEYNDLLRQIGLDIYQEQKDALTEIISLTEKLIKQETEDKVKGLEAQIDAFKKIIELNKKSLAASWEEENYDKEVAKRLKAIAELQAKISQLERDDSRSAQAEKAKLAEELAELQEDLADYQAKYSYEAQLEALDKDADAHEKTKNEEIQVLKETIDTAEKLYDAAIARIDAGWDQLYQDLMVWNSQYGDMIDGPDSITSAWQTAKAAAEEYGSVIQALSAIKSEIYTMQDTTSGPQSYGNTQGGSNSSGSNSSSSKQSQIDSILSQMKNNASKWGSASESYRKSLEAANEALAAQLSVLMGRSVVKDYANGIWYLDYIGGTRLYHTGLEQGYVGADTSNKDEVLAVLQKGELVMTKDQYSRIFNSLTNGTYSVLDAFVGNMAGSSTSVSDLAASITNNNFDNINETFSFEPHFHMNGTLTEDNMRQFADMYAEHTIDKLNSATRRMGMKNSLGSSMLRG